MKESQSKIETSQLITVTLSSDIYDRIHLLRDFIVDVAVGGFMDGVAEGYVKELPE